MKAAPADLPERRKNVARRGVVDVADEAQGEMVVLDIDPARAGNSAAHIGEIQSNVGGDLEAREQTGHGSSSKCAPANVHGPNGFGESNLDCAARLELQTYSEPSWHFEKDRSAKF